MCKRLHPGFETQGRRHQKSKTGVSVAPLKGHVSSKNFKKKYNVIFLLFESLLIAYLHPEPHPLYLLVGDVLEPEELFEHGMLVALLYVRALFLHLPRHQAHLQRGNNVRITRELNCTVPFVGYVRCTFGILGLILRLLHKIRLLVSVSPVYCWRYKIHWTTSLPHLRVITFAVTRVDPLWGSKPHVCSTACNGSRIVRCKIHYNIPNQHTHY